MTDYPQKKKKNDSRTHLPYDRFTTGDRLALWGGGGVMTLYTMYLVVWLYFFRNRTLENALFVAVVFGLIHAAFICLAATHRNELTIVLYGFLAMCLWVACIWSASTGFFVQFIVYVLTGLILIIGAAIRMEEINSR